MRIFSPDVKIHATSIIIRVIQIRDRIELSTAYYLAISISRLQPFRSCQQKSVIEGNIDTLLHSPSFASADHLVLVRRSHVAFPHTKDQTPDAKVIAKSNRRVFDKG
jgi:hypothetical protein